jgi:hypothetical protein
MPARRSIRRFATQNVSLDNEVSKVSYERFDKRSR